MRIFKENITRPYRPFTKEINHITIIMCKSWVTDAPIMSTSMDKKWVYLTTRVRNTNYQTTIKERLLEISGKY